MDSEDANIISLPSRSESSDDLLSPLEQDVIDEYERLAKNMNKASWKTVHYWSSSQLMSLQFALVLKDMAEKPMTEVLDGLRQLERKTGLVFTLLKASVYSIVLQQEIYSGDHKIDQNNDQSKQQQ
ncbi:putative dash complex subunit dad3 [Erysiphe neolycopersici]|uniref:DASH complex subunit DAD3 n=1 Tax=Erysiphe neolycopersici TaxID=212602 RepID=A0A420I2J6_9PEZI|nr:putative dash complex subunit dad3 [Erysiphe neolycopersici]